MQIAAALLMICWICSALVFEIPDGQLEQTVAATDSEPVEVTAVNNQTTQSESSVPVVESATTKSTQAIATTSVIAVVPQSASLTVGSLYQDGDLHPAHTTLSEEQRENDMECTHQEEIHHPADVARVCH